LQNSHVTIVTTKETYDGILTDLARQIQQKGAARPHVILQKACIKGMKRDVMIREWQGPYDEIISIAKWTLDPAEASPPPSAGAGKGRRSEGGFRTDADISRSAQLGQERVLVAWDAGSPPPASSTLHSGLDADTFGSSTAGASGGAGGKKGGWDQFAENERRFGTKTDFDEEMYTTKLVRNGEGFKDRERKAEAMAREIMGVRASVDLHHPSHLWLTDRRRPLRRRPARTLTCRRSAARPSARPLARRTGTSKSPSLDVVFDRQLTRCVLQLLGRRPERQRLRPAERAQACRTDAPSTAGSGLAAAAAGRPAAVELAHYGPGRRALNFLGRSERGEA
jgi:hypothetical protein